MLSGCILYVIFYVKILSKNFLYGIFARLLFFVFILLSFNAHSEDEVVIFDFIHEQKILSQSLFGYIRDNQLYLPVSALADSLNYPYSISLSPLTVEFGGMPGFKRRMLSELNTGELLFEKEGSESVVLPEKSWLKEYVEFDGELYIMARDLENIWPITFGFNYRTMLLRMDTESFVPSLESVKRKEYRKKKLKAQLPVSTYSAAGLPYKNFSRPIIDWQLNLKGMPVSKKIQLSGRNDIIGLGNRWNMIMTDDQSPRLTYWNANYRATSDDEQPVLPGGIRSFDIGDIGIKSITDVFPYAAGVGFSISTFPEIVNAFDNKQVVGQAPEGWEAELYINGQLSDFQYVSDDGIYRFSIGLVSGLNSIVVKVYGPYGEIKEHDYNVFITPEYLKKGDLEVEYSYIDSEGSISQWLYESRGESIGGHKVVLGIGLGAEADLRFNVISRIDQDMQRHFIMGGELNRYMYDAIWRLGLYSSDKYWLTSLKVEKSDIESSIKFEINDKSLWLESLKDKKELLRELSFLWKKSVNNISQPFHLESELFYSDYEGYHSWSVRQIIRTVYSGVTYALTGACAQNEYQVCRGSGRVGWSYQGARVLFSESKAFSGNNDSVRSANVFIPASLWSDFICAGYSGKPENNYCNNLALGFKYVRGSEETLKSRLTWSADFQTISLGSQVTWDSNSGYGFAFSLKGSLLPASTGGYDFSSKQLTNPVYGRVFLDENNNGVREGHEESLNGIRFYQRGAGVSETVGGGVWMSVRPGHPLSLMMQDFDDPYRIPLEEVKIVASRRERVSNVDWPVIDTGAVEGSLMDGRGRPVSGAHLELYKKGTDEKVSEMYTAYDGFFVMDFIPPGEYVLYLKGATEKTELAQPVVSQDNLWVVLNLVYEDK